MNDDGDRGLKILYDLLVKAAEFPGENQHSPAVLSKWHTQLEYLHGIMLQFYSPQLIQKYEKIRQEMESLPSGQSDASLSREYELSFQLLGVVSRSFIQEKLLLENPMGVRIVYDLFVSASSFPRKNSLTISTLLQWFDMIRGLHHILEGYLDMYPQFLREHGIIIRQLKECSKLYPSDSYVLSSREWLINWAGMLSRLLQEKNLLVPEEFSFSDRIGNSGGRK
jgi:hypothetical protein